MTWGILAKTARNPAIPFALLTSFTCVAQSRAENRSFRSVFYVDDYGAKHDGVDDQNFNDDWSAITAAIAEASGVGGIVQFGAGFYWVQGDSNPAFVITSPILIRGVGISDISVADSSGAVPRDSLQTTIVWNPIAAPPSRVFMKVGHASASLEGFGMENITISSPAQGGANSDHLVWWAGVSRSHMENVNLNMKRPPCQCD